MATYIGMGSRFVSATVDKTGFNPGRWTAHFTPELLNVNLPYFEVHHICVYDGAPGSTFKVQIGTWLWDVAARGDLNSWDPNQPLQLIPGNNLYFLYSSPATDGFSPEVTIWLRYDEDILANQRTVGKRV